jgi:putative GTP pyrophosphokinase
MTGPQTTPSEPTELFERLIGLYSANADQINLFTQQLRLLTEHGPIARYIHSVKWRTKDVDHLRDKLWRRWKKCQDEAREFDLNEGNFFEKINDLAGVRILHLYTRQAEHIHRLLQESLEQQMYVVLDCFARTWDDEYREFYESIGIRTEPSPRMYTSIHYVVQANRRSVTGEIQVRTLAEEIWGEVDHTINYPHESDKLACREQIRVLARATSTCSRLVDAIFATHEEGGSTGQSVDELA